jgi:PAS domain S-box-containing protein
LAISRPGPAGGRETEPEKESSEWPDIVEHASDLISVLGPDGTIRYHNPAVHRVLGYAPEELVGRRALEFVHPEDLPGALRALGEVVAQPGVAAPVDFRFRHKDGSWRTLEGVANNLLDRPEVAGIVVDARDVTERRRLEADLRASEERYRDLVEHSLDMICTHDLEGTLLSVNEGAARHLGFAVEELVGRNIREGLAPEVQHEFDAYLERIRREGFAEGYMRVVTRSGEPLIWQYRNTLRTIGTTAPIVRGMAHDVTELVRTQRELRASEERYRSLFEGAADAVLVADARGRYVDANAALSELTGFTRDEIRAMRAGALSATGTGTVKAVRDEIERDGRWRGEYEVLRKDGSRVPVESRVRRVEFPTGPAYIATLRDISERKALRQLEQVFLSMVTHDLRGPLSALSAYAQILQKRRTFDEGVVQSIRSQVDRLNRLIEDLREVLEIRGGRFSLHPGPVDLADLAREVARTHGVAEGRSVVVEGPATLVGWWDRDRLTQVLENLLVNAFKYSPTESEVRVTVQAASTADAQPAARVSVSDLGQGIPVEALPRLFDQFYRADAARSSGVKGAGLGLYTSRLLVEAHGGRIWVESAGLGQGSTFTIELPRGEIRSGSPDLPL